MKYINPNLNRGVVNLFADYILKEINKTGNHDSVIEVTDTGKFILINGMTSLDSVLPLPAIKQSFIEEYSGTLSLLGYSEMNIIDLIVYDVNLVKKDTYWFDFYNTCRPTYTNLIIDNSELDNSLSITNDLIYEVNFTNDDIDELPNFIYPPLSISSEFPYGHSLDMGRSHYYYSEYIAHNIMTPIVSNKLSFKISTRINEDEDFMIDLKSNSIYNDGVVKSMVLDVFDFDLTSFNEKLIGYDYLEDLTSPFTKKPWLVKDRTTDCIIF
jgi:hypothetical protein